MHFVETHVRGAGNNVVIELLSLINFFTHFYQHTPFVYFYIMHRVNNGVNNGVNGILNMFVLPTSYHIGSGKTVE